MFSVLGRDAISETLREKFREREEKVIKRFILTVKTVQTNLKVFILLNRNKVNFAIIFKHLFGLTRWVRTKFETLRDIERNDYGLLLQKI